MASDLEGSKSANPMRAVLDIIYQLVPLLEEFDTLKYSTSQSLRHLWNQARDIDSQVKAWKDTISAEDDMRPLHLDPQTAAALLYEELYDVHLNKLLIDLLSHAPTASSFEKAPSIRGLKIDRWNSMRRICLMFEYFFEGRMRLSGRVMFVGVFQTGLIGIADSRIEHDSLFTEQARDCGLVCNKISAEGYLPWDECADLWKNLQSSCRDENSKLPQAGLIVLG
ncbi:MAG: hypothetical protein Q9195_003095 [Heterodermia aff. obscurata]